MSRSVSGRNGIWIHIWMTPEPVLFVLDHRGMGDVIILFFRLILVIFFKLLFSFPACPETKVNEANEGFSAIQEKQEVIWRLSSWCYSLIWNDTCSHVLSPVFNVVEAKCGILRPESTTFSQDNNSDSNVEDVVETFPKPSPWFEGICHPAFPSPEPVSKLLKFK